jgi:acetylornithine deacetylase/succinyl-diaminopimelate desuccinylase-like protein
MEKVLAYLKENEGRFVAQLGDYVRFPSVSAQREKHGADMKACCEWLLAQYRALGLEVALHATAGNPILLARTPRRKGRKHFVVYGHYDVQPPEPFELWKSPPFEPRIEGRAMFGRGACDNKGQNLAHLKAVEAYLKTGTELPVDLTFLIEGEEEVGSRNLEKFLKDHRAELKCDAIVISDTGMPSKEIPALTYALRGITALEIKLTGPGRDLHSGIFGGSVENPAMALCRLLAQVHDKNGHVAIPGFYGDVEPLSKFEREQFKRLPFNAEQYRKLLGVPALFGEKGFSHHEQRSARPTFEINGLTSGYQGEGSKTIVPSWASAKITMRLVPNQKPEKIQKLVQAHLRKLCPPTVKMELRGGHGGDPYIVSPTSPMAQASLRALKLGFDAEPIVMREGGSIPIVNDFKRILGADTLLLGLALPDDNAHSPNEKFDLDCFANGMRMAAHLWQELART